MNTVKWSTLDVCSFPRCLLSATGKTKFKDLLGGDTIAHTNIPALPVGLESEDRPYQTGKTILRLPKAGGFLLPADPDFVIRVFSLWLGFRASLCSFSTPLFGTC